MSKLASNPKRLDTSGSPASQIFFCGDVHGNFEHIIEAVIEHEPAAIVLLGDIQARKPLEQELELSAMMGDTEVWFIHGNHDTDTEADYDNLFGSALANRNLHGRVVEVAGVRIAGLGGIFRGQVWQPPNAPNFKSSEDFTRRQGSGNRWRDGLALRHRSTIFPDVYDQLAKLRADVLVTHEAPSVHPHGFDTLNTLANKMRVQTTFHGHHHDSIDYSAEWDRLGHKAYGVGFCGITTLEGGVIRAGDFDSERRS